VNDAELIRAVEANLFEFYRRAAALAELPARLEPDLSWVNGSPSRWPNTIFGANFSAADAAEKIRFASAAVRRGDAPPFWSVGPCTRPLRLGGWLLEGGFEKAWDTAGMGMNLPELMTDFDAPRELTIERVVDDRTLGDWARVVSLGLFGCVESEVIHYHNLMRKVMGSQGVELFLGRWNGAPAASSNSFLSDGIAGIYQVATLPEFRGKGCGRSLTLAPLLRAREAGARVAILQATALGEPVYRRLGFRRLCNLARYRLAASTQT
jgi:GNAT superfamily N-acetyltransferase